MARLAGEVGDHPDAARVVFVFAPVESVAALRPFVYVCILLHIENTIAHSVPSTCFHHPDAKAHNPRNISSQSVTIHVTHTLHHYSFTADPALAICKGILL
jgi:hypothetical protein